MFVVHENVSKYVWKEIFSLTPFLLGKNNLVCFPPVTAAQLVLKQDLATHEE